MKKDINRKDLGGGYTDLSGSTSINKMFYVLRPLVLNTEYIARKLT